MTPDKIRDELWRRGNLRFLIKDRPAQLSVYNFMRGRTERHIVAALHRRAGKSYLAAVLALEKAMAKPYQGIIYTGPTAKMLRGITKPMFRKVLSTCPVELQPKYNSKDEIYEFSNGSTIALLGSDLGNADSSRGRDGHFAIFDEEGFATNPEYTVGSVLMPAVLAADGQLLHISTPALTASHPFSQRMREAEGQPYFFKYTVYDNPLVTPSLLEEYKKESGGAHTTTFRREYLCEIVTEETRAVLPEMSRARFAEWRGEAMGKPVVSASIDFAGMTAVTVCARDGETFGILDERILVGGNADTLVRSLTELFDKHKIHGADRVCFADMDEDGRISLGGHGIPIATPYGYHAPTMSGLLRAIIERGHFHISENAPTTRRHLTDVIWNEQRTKYEPSGDFGRFDAVHAAFIGFSVAQPFRPAQEFTPPWQTRTNTGQRKMGMP